MLFAYFEGTVSKSALIRRCTALLAILVGLAVAHFCFELTHDRNWMQAVERTYFGAIALLATLTLPYK